MSSKYVWILLAVLHFAVPAESTTSTELLSEVDLLVTEKKYLSAFKLLNSRENGDSDPDIVLKKVDIALNYFETRHNLSIINII